MTANIFARTYWHYLIIAGLVIALLLMGQCASNNRGKYEESVALNSVLADTLKHYKGKDGENQARISQFRTEKINDFLDLQSSNKEVAYLQEQVKKYKGELGKSGSVTVVEATGTYKGETPTTVVETKDPTAPIYLGDSKDTFGEWAHITSKATRENTTYEFTTKDKFTLVLGTEKTGFLGFGKGKPFADVTNLNPYSTTKSVRSYEVTPAKEKRFTLGIGGTYGATFLQGNMGLGTTIGVTANYTLFKL